MGGQFESAETGQIEWFIHHHPFSLQNSIIIIGAPPLLPLQLVSWRISSSEPATT